MPVNDGGPAFPFDAACGFSAGMSLRDWFAGQALDVVLGVVQKEFIDAVVRMCDGEIGGSGMSYPQIAARHAYAIADAMIKERSRPCP